MGIIEEDRWLSGIFGCRVFKIALGPRAANGYTPEDPCELISRHIEGQSTAVYYTRVDTDRVDLMQQLSSVGFYIVDVSVTFSREPNTQRQLWLPSAAGCSIGEVRPGQAAEVLKIASECFRYSRFHLDPAVPRAVANRIKHDWVLSYLQKGRGEALFVAELEKRPIGFLAVCAAHLNGSEIRRIDLMGVSEPFQHRGIGRALVTFFINRYQHQCDELQVGTQAANVPSMRLYEACGFSVSKTAYVMHLHQSQGDPVLKQRCESAHSIS